MSQAVEKLLDQAEHAQEDWAARIVRHRLKLLGRLPAQMLEDQQRLLESIARPNATTADKLGTELLPLADACRFVAKRGRQILAPKSSSWLQGRWWMGRVSVTKSREPWGTVLILAPSNYPLLLPGVQIIQALAAGNATMVKPAPGCEEVMHCFKQCLIACGMPGELVQILDTSIESAKAAIELGVDKVLLTGSAETGRAVGRQLAETLTPSTMELSGCDAVFLTPEANLKRAAQCIGFGLRLNGGATCIAPRRIFVTKKRHDAFVSELLQALKSNNSDAEGYFVPSQPLAVAHEAITDALSQGAKLLFGDQPGECSQGKAEPEGQERREGRMRPVVLDNVTQAMKVAREDIFAPVTSILAVNDMQAAVTADRSCPYALGASVFGPKSYAEHWAGEIHAGCVAINDVIVPSGDPRVAFGGWDRSGWGVTRGAEGLLEMTRLKMVCVRKGSWLPHLEPLAQDESMLREMFRLLHGKGISTRLQALQNLVKLGRASRSG